MNESFPVDTKVNKKTGYLFPGIVRSVFTKINGEKRYVVECIAEGCSGMLHIFSEKDLVKEIDENGHV